MKRIPLSASFLAAIFLTVCFFQAQARGIGFAPPLTEWELHPVWWHFDRLADCGDCLVVTPYFYMVLLFVFIRHYLPAAMDPAAAASFAWLSIAAIIAIECCVVFYLTQYLCRRFGEDPNQSRQPTAPRGRG